MTASPANPSPEQSVERGSLERGLGLMPATALNMIDMVGIGPFIVAPLVIQAMGGPQCLLAWVAGAALALLDGFVWSELGAAMPRSRWQLRFSTRSIRPGTMGPDCFHFFLSGKR